MSRTYQSRTIRNNDSGRYAYLPIFPSDSPMINQNLLLANVATYRLNANQIVQRQSKIDSTKAKRIIDNYDCSDLFSIEMNDALQMSERLHVDLSIILFNADRLRSYCFYFLNLYERFQQRILYHDPPQQRPEHYLNSEQMMIVLEFFLQIDIDRFFMKTCCFQQVDGRNSIEGLFSNCDQPALYHQWQPCQQLTCFFCQKQSIVNLNTSHMHTFNNGYISYLNCPITCSTTNLIYVMTCPCGEYEFIDSTSQTLFEAIENHRQRSNQALHHILTGSSSNHVENEQNIRMRLYQHSSRCEIALRQFLDVNPDYWCFIPRDTTETMYVNYNRFGEPVEHAFELDYLVRIGVIKDQRIIAYLEQIPDPPTGYAFSFQDRQQQRSFFKQFLSENKLQHMPYTSVDLYNYKPIAILPEQCSSTTRFIIETLFIIHTEAKLNMICPIGGDPKRTHGRVFQQPWCRSLVHPSMLKSSSIRSNTDMFSSL